MLGKYIRGVLLLDLIRYIIVFSINISSANAQHQCGELSMHIASNIGFIYIDAIYTPAGYSFWHPDPVMPRNILPQHGQNPKKVNFMGPTTDQPDYILPAPDRIESFYH